MFLYWKWVSVETGLEYWGFLLIRSETVIRYTEMTPYYVEGPDIYSRLYSLNLTLGYPKFVGYRLVLHCQP